MQYKAIKIISGKEIIEAEACRTDAEKFIKEFGYYDEIEWTEEVEDWIKENISGGIGWLIQNDFIEPRYYINYKNNKIYCFRNEYGIYKVSRIANRKYMWVKITETDACWSSNTYYTPQEVFMDAKDTGIGGERYEIKEFDSIQEAIEFYYPKNETKELTTIEELKVFADNFKTILNHKDKNKGRKLCSVVHDIARTIECQWVICSDCPLNEKIE